MKSFNRLLKGCLTLAAPFGGFAYFNRSSGSEIVQTAAYQNPTSSDFFNRYIAQNNLVSPQIYEKFQKNYTFNHFFEKALLKDLEGLNVYSVFLNKDSHDVLTNDVQVSQAEKQKLLESAKLHCTFSAKESLQGRGGVINNGVAFTLFDNISGCLAFMASDYSPAVTAYLKMSYEMPMAVGKEYVAVVEVDRVEGRKVFLKGKVVDQENNVYTSMESLFIKPKWANLYLSQVYRYFLQDKKTQNVKVQQAEPELILKKGLALAGF